LDDGDDLTKKKSAVNEEEDDDDDNFSAKAATDRAAEAPPQVCSGWHFHSPGPLRPLFASFLEEPEQLPPTHLDSWLDSVVQPYEPVYEPVTRAYSAPRMASNEKCQPPPPPKPPASCPPDVAKPQRFTAVTPPRSSPSILSGRRSVTFSGKASGYSARSSPSDRSGSTIKVDNLNYRETCLAAANIFFLTRKSKGMSAEVTDLVSRMGRKRDSVVEMTVEDADADFRRENIAIFATEPTVENYYGQRVFALPLDETILQRDDRTPMTKECVPDTADTEYRVVTPVPDMLFGYSSEDAFTQAQLVQLNRLGEWRYINGGKMVLPFLAAEFKGPSAPLWVAENQCLGVASSCVKVAERLRTKVLTNVNSDEWSCEIHSYAFSVAMNNSEARLYVTWKDEDADAYKTQRVRSYALATSEDFIVFQRTIRNIIDWGRNERLESFRQALDDMAEQERKRASARAKSRSPPLSAADASSSTAKRR
jgi:hypothetical protein